MKRLVLAGTAGLLCLAALPASADLERTVVLDRDDLVDGTIAQEWTGSPGAGLNTSWFLDDVTAEGTCSDADETSRCDSTLIQVDPDLFVDPKKGATLTFRIEGFGPTDDYDLRVYNSNDKGEAVGEWLGSPDSDVQASSPLPIDPRSTSLGDYETKVVTGAKPGRYYLVEVVYFAVPDGTSYTGSATLSKVPAQPEPAPAA